MKQRVTSQSSQGLLLVEATLTAAILAVSLVFISRSFGTGLRALGQARRYEAALVLAQEKLNELEAEAEATQKFQSEQRGEVQDRRFGWSIEVNDFQAPHELLNRTSSNPPALDQLTLSVTESVEKAPVQVNLTTLVPHEWVPDIWSPSE